MELALSLSIQPSPPPLPPPPLDDPSLCIPASLQNQVSSFHRASEDAVPLSPDPSLHLHLPPFSAIPPLVNQNTPSSSYREQILMFSSTGFLFQHLRVFFVAFYVDGPQFEGEVWWSQCRGKRKKESEERVKGSNSSNREEEGEEEEEEGVKVCSWKMMSDEEENGNMCRKKLRLSKEQSAFLEESFKEHHTLNPKQKLVLAKRLNLRPRQVEVWFQNRRARTKLKQTEVECEYLRRWCETLREENRKIQKEVQELRALKASQPLYMQVPATTLTICPSCDRTSSSRRPFHPLPDPLHL